LAGRTANRPLGDRRPRCDYQFTAAFEVAYSVLEARAKAWLSLGFEEMAPEYRQAEIDRVGDSMLVM